MVRRLCFVFLVLGITLQPGASQYSDRKTRAVRQPNSQTPPPAPAPPRNDDRQTPPPRDRGGASATTVTAVGAGALIGGMLLGNLLSGGPKDPAKIFEKEGPVLPPQFRMSSLVVRGFVRGDWPAVVEYEVGRDAFVMLSVVSDAGTEIVHRLPSGPGRFQYRLQLPGAFGAEPNPATYTLRALSDSPKGGPMVLMPLRVFGLGAGPRAVGSVGIDQVKFGPPEIRPRARESARYGFRSHHGFQKVVAEFMHISRGQGFVDATRVEEDKLDGPVGREEIVRDRQWRPKKKTFGDFFVQVRGWMGKKEGDWVIAWSDDVVNVSE